MAAEALVKRDPLQKTQYPDAKAMKTKKSTSVGQLKSMCKYGRGNCHKEAAIKDNGLPHKFCEYHRQQANRIQRAVRRRKRALVEAQSVMTGGLMGEMSMPNKMRKVQSEPILGSITIDTDPLSILHSPTLSSNASTASLAESLVVDEKVDVMNNSNPWLDFLQDIPLLLRDDASEQDQSPIFSFREAPDVLGMKGSVSMMELSTFDRSNLLDPVQPMAPTSTESEDFINNQMFFYNIEEDILGNIPSWDTSADLFA